MANYFPKGLVTLNDEKITDETKMELGKWQEG